MIFLSHSLKDTHRLMGLVAGLRRLGLEVCIAEEIRLGESIIGWMRGAMERDDLLLLVAWSRDAESSPYVNIEIDSFAYFNPKPGPLAFMLLDETPVPRLFADRKRFRASGDTAREVEEVRRWAEARQARTAGGGEVGEAPGAAAGGAATPHPLHIFPRGPMVGLDWVTHELVLAYARAFPTKARAHTAIREANRMRAEAEQGDAPPTTVGIEYLPAFESGSYEFWQAALDEACRHGPRMLAALLLIQQRYKLPEAAGKEFDRLLRHLRGPDAQGG